MSIKQVPPETRVSPAPTSIGAGFKRLKGLLEESSKPLHVAPNARMQKLEELWNALVLRPEEMTVDSCPTNPDQFFYLKIKNEILKGYKFSSKEIEEFSLALVRHQEEYRFDMKAGLFLSTLINMSDDSSFVLHTYHLNTSLFYLGMHNTKDIVIYGDGGKDVGKHMSDGKIRVKGNAVRVGAYATAGAIIVEGNCKWPGLLLQGAIIHVNGDSTEKVGEGMASGAICLFGNYTQLGDITGGKVFHKGELILDK